MGAEEESEGVDCSRTTGRGGGQDGKIHPSVLIQGILNVNEGEGKVLGGEGNGHKEHPRHHGCCSHCDVSDESMNI